MEFKDKIKTLRIAAGLTMAELAKKINVSTPTIQRYESGEIQNVRRDKIKLLADALNTTPAFLMGWENDSNDNNLEILNNYYKNFNDVGKQKILEYAEDMSINDKYTK